MAAANFIHSSFCLFRFNLIIGIGDGDRALFLGGVPAGGAARGGVLAGVARASARDSLSVRQGKALTGTGRKGVGLGGGVTVTSERGRGVTSKSLAENLNRRDITNVYLHNNNHTFYQARFPDQVSSGNVF